MCHAIVEMPEPVFEALMSHLLPADGCAEEAAFVFARTATAFGVVRFRSVDWVAIGSTGFVHRSPFFLELTDDSRAAIIKRAHVLDASIVEFHSHPSGNARFSPSDKLGLEEFVPHVMWRLRGRPFAAVVVAPDGCDALAWLSTNACPDRLSRMIAGRRVVEPIGWTLRNWEKIGHDRLAFRSQH